MSRNGTESGGAALDLNKRVIDLTTAELIELVDARLALFVEGAPARANEDAQLDRKGAADFLKISLAKLDALCRREVDPLEFSLCGDARRFDKDTIRAWLRRQPKGARK